MYYLVLDLEWNTANPRSKTPSADLPPFHMEIIEIGAVLLDKSLRIVDRFSMDVKPKYYTVINHHVGKLTNRDNRSLQYGAHFPDAIYSLEQWIAKWTQEEYLLCTWSKSDIKPWRSNLEHYGLLPEKASKILDVQRLFSLYMKKLGEQKSIAFALEYLEIENELPLHNAVNDAYYTALIFRKVIHGLQERRFVSNNTKRLFEHLSKLSIDPSLLRKQSLSFEGFATKEDAFRKLKMLTWTCPACGQNLSGNGRWKTKKALRFHRKLHCKDHGIVTVHASVHRNRQREEELWQISAKTQLELPF